MDKINIIDSNDSITLSWDNMDNVKYYLEGCNYYFNYEVLKVLDSSEITLNKDDYNDYHKYRISYVDISNDKDLIIKQIDSNGLINSISYESDISTFEVKTIKSFKGYTLSFMVNKVYDKYLVYRKEENKYKLLIESDDFQVTSELFEENNTYYVEAILNNKVIAKSNDVICIDSNIERIGNKISVIIPAFNASLFLPRTLDSVILSSFNELNITVVNDGSNDNTLEVCNWYSNKYSYIKVVDKENTGVSETRNVGVKSVDGDYIAFLDSDDLVSHDMYELLYDAAIKEEADVAISKTLIRENDKDPVYVLDIKKEVDYLVYSYSKMFDEHIRNTWDNIYFVAVWNKIVKREVALNVRFPKDNYFEDSAYTPALYTYVNKFVFVPKALYIWDKRKRTTVGTYSTAYSKFTFDESVNHYLTATYYPLLHSNVERKDYITYDVIRDLVNYYEKIKTNKSETSIKYRKKLITIINLFDMTNNDRIKSDKDLLDKINNILNV